MPEPVSEPVTAPATPVAPMRSLPPSLKIAPVKASPFKAIGRVIMGFGLMAIGSVMTHSCDSQSEAKPTVSVAAPVIHKSHIAHKKHKKHLYNKRKHLPYAMDSYTKPDIEEIESRLTTVEERLDRNGIS